MRRLALLALLLAPSIPRPTGACSAVSENAGERQLDPAFSTDLVPPSAVTASAVVDRDDDDGGGGGGCNGAQCVTSGSFVFMSVYAMDDRAQKEQLGYRLTLASGELPAGMNLPTTAVISDSGELRLRFPNDAPAFAFELEIRAVDLNGNNGPATVIAVSDPG